MKSGVCDAFGAHCAPTPRQAAVGSCVLGQPAGAGGPRAWNSATCRTAMRSGTGALGATAGAAAGNSGALQGNAVPRANWSSKRQSMGAWPENNAASRLGAWAAGVAWPEPPARRHHAARQPLAPQWCAVSDASGPARATAPTPAAGPTPQRDAMRRAESRRCCARWRVLAAWRGGSAGNCKSAPVGRGLHCALQNPALPQRRAPNQSGFR